MADTNWLREAGAKSGGGLEVLTDDESFDTASSTGSRFRDYDAREEDPELGIEKVHISSTEDLGDEGSSGAENAEGEIKSCEEQLGLHVDV
jgi:hypothetical protein